jgi:hypothetical protein
MGSCRTSDQLDRVADHPRAAARLPTRTVVNMRRLIRGR